MQFELGDGTDSALCNALRHEVYRCNDAFIRFYSHAAEIIAEGKTRVRSYRAYNAYSGFIHHLYEFLLGCMQRDKKDTNFKYESRDQRIEITEGYILHHAQRVLDNYRVAIENGTAPDWVNPASYYEEKVSKSFPADFRNCRNKLCGHVAYERSSKLSLSEFYAKYHKYLYHLYRDALENWGSRGDEFPDMKEITDFTVCIERDKQHREDRPAGS